jgi:hypothetical protein
MALLWQAKMQQQALRCEKSDKEDAQLDGAGGEGGGQ